MKKNKQTITDFGVLYGPSLQPGCKRFYPKKDETNKCVECKKIVDDMHVDAVKSSKGFHYKTKIFSAPSTLTATPFESTTEEFHALRATHEDEILNRVRWCLDHGMTPAYDHLHLAPGDDRRFMVIFLSCVFCGVCRLLRFLFPSPH